MGNPSRGRLGHWDRAKLVLFAVRHTLGVGIFAWLTFQTRRLGEGNLWLVIALLGFAYLAFALVAGTRLLAWYQKRERQ